MRTIQRQGDTMVAVETVPAIINFNSILEATKVVADEFGDNPWDNCDGLEHTTHTVSGSADHRRKMRGYLPGMIIQLPDREDYGLYDWHRKQGASKQVAREKIAAERRRTLDQLVEWYTYGWEAWGVVCNFETLGEEFTASTWGFYDSESAEETRLEIAYEVADQLEKAGFTVTDQPCLCLPYNHKHKQDRLHRNLNLQNWAS